MKELVLLVLLCASFSNLFGQSTYISVQDGSWSDESTWSCSGSCATTTPGSEDNVIIGHEVILGTLYDGVDTPPDVDPPWDHTGCITILGGATLISAAGNDVNGLSISGNGTLFLYGTLQFDTCATVPDEFGVCEFNDGADFAVFDNAVVHMYNGSTAFFSDDIRQYDNTLWLVDEGACYFLDDDHEIYGPNTVVYGSGAVSFGEGAGGGVGGSGNNWEFNDGADTSQVASTIEVFTGGNGGGGLPASCDPNFPLGVEVFSGTGAVIALGDFVWWDQNGDGIQDASEPGVEGVLVNVFLNGTQIAQDTTDSDGLYSFTDIPPGNYTVEIVVPNGVATTTPVTVTDTVNTVPNNTFDFGLNFSSIGDTIISDDDGTGIDGVLVFLQDSLGNVIDSTITSSGGMYLFDGLPAADYTILIAASNFEAAGALENMTNTTDPDGGLDNTSAVALAIGSDNLDQDFGYSALASIGDTITNDDTNAPIDGVIVNLLDDMGMIIATTTTANGGMYLFDSLLAGDYTVVIDAANFAAGGALENMTNTTDPDSGLNNTSAVDLAAGVDNLDQDFGYLEFGSITGSVTDSEGAAIEGVQLILQDAFGNSIDTVMTLADGTYSFEDVLPGDYTVVEIQPEGYDDVSELEGGLDGDNPDDGIDNSIAVTVDAGEVDAGNNFVELLANASIGDQITNDQTLAGIDGVLMVLYDDMGMPIDSMITANGGQYLFEGLPSGAYTVFVDISNFEIGGPLEGFTATSDPQGDNDNRSDSFLDASEQEVNDGDFGFTPAILGVQMLKFDAKPVGSKVQLTWNTAAELDNDHFEVEHSADGTKFKIIGKIFGNGTVSGISHYSFKDENPSSGRNYYRIKQVDYDGKYTHSEIRTVIFIANIDFKVYPTVTNSSLTVKLGMDVKGARISILSMNGSVVKSHVLDGSSETIAVDMLAADTYILYVQIGTEVMHKKFVKVD